MWIIATEDLSDFIPDSGRNGGNTQVDVSSMGLPRLFQKKLSATLALGHWMNGPYIGVCEGGSGWYYNVQTHPLRRQVWGGKLAAREVQMVRIIQCLSGSK